MESSLVSKKTYILFILFSLIKTLAKNNPYIQKSILIYHIKSKLDIDFICIINT